MIDVAFFSSFLPAITASSAFVGFLQQTSVLTLFSACPLIGPAGRTFFLMCTVADSPLDGAKEPQMVINLHV